MSSNVKITTTLDLAGLTGRVTDAACDVLTDYETIIVQTYQDQWADWKYKGRRKGAPRLVSFRAWKGRVHTTGNNVTLSVINEAKGYASGKPYAAFVHKAGEKTPLHKIISKQVIDTIIPQLRNELSAAINTEINKPSTRKTISTDRPSQTEILEQEF